MILIKDEHVERMRKFVAEVECIEMSHQEEASNLVAIIDEARRGYPNDSLAREASQHGPR